MNRPFFQLISLQFKEFYREPEIIFWAFIVPIVLSWLLGVAIGSGGETSSQVGLVAGSEAAEKSWRPWMERVRDKSRTQVRYGEDRGAPKNGPGFAFLLAGKDEIVRALKQGRIALFIELSPDKERLSYYFDPRNGEAQMAYLVLERALGHGGYSSNRNRVVPLKIQGTRYIDFLVPGLLSMGIMSSALWGIGWGLIEIRMKKLLRRMAATPMRKSHFLLSHCVTRFLVNMLEFLALYLFTYWYFGVRIQGSAPALAAVILSGNLAFVGIAIFTSSRTANPRVGNGLINAITFPMMLLSGIFFSYHHFPAWAIPLVQKLPLTVLADCMRSVFNEGADLAQVALPSSILAAIGVTFFCLGLRIFKWY